MHKLFAHQRTQPLLETAVQSGLWLLVALMPFHAFLTVWLGGWLAPRPLLQAWKELVIVVLAVLAAGLIWRQPARLSRLNQLWLKVAGAFALIAILVSLARQVTPAEFIWGAKTDLELFVVAGLAAIVATRRFVQILIGTLFVTAGAVACFALIQAYILPPDALASVGYGPGSIPPFLTIVTPDGLMYRFSSTLGGPNQLGAYLIIPTLIAISLGMTRAGRFMMSTAPLWLLASWHTYSRSAWVGLVTAGAALASSGIRFSTKRLILLTMAIILVAVSTIGLYSVSPAVRATLVRGGIFAADPALSSDAQHVASLAEGWDAMISTPFGHGLGTAGPATFSMGDPIIIENQFLQIGYETGLLGLALYVSIFGIITWRLLRQRPYRPLARGLGAAIVGIMAACMALPVLADSTLALCLGILAGTIATPEPTNNTEDINHG